MFKKSIKSLIVILFLGTILSILFLSLSSGAIPGKPESPLDLATLSFDSKSPFEQKIGINAPTLIVSQVYEINDDYVGASFGDDDNIVDAGETIELRLQLVRPGSLPPIMLSNLIVY